MCDTKLLIFGGVVQARAFLSGLKKGEVKGVSKKTRFFEKRASGGASLPETKTRFFEGFVHPARGNLTQKKDLGKHGEIGIL